MIIVGLDLATTTGIAVMDGDRLLHAESFKAKGTSDGEVFLVFKNWLWAMLRAHDVQHGAIEEVLPSGLTRVQEDGTEKTITNMKTDNRVRGFRAVALMVFAAQNIPCEQVHLGTWRKAFLGNGRATKDDAVAQCKRLRWTVPNKDAAEACGVAFWLGGHIRLTRAIRPGDLFEGEAA